MIPSRRALLVGLAVLVVAVLAQLPSFDDPGAEMDEGGLVAYPSLALDGLVPGRDFETFYGPGAPWLIAGGFEVFGPTLTVERLIGLGFRLLTIASIFVLVLPAGIALAAIGALAALIMLLPLSLPALAILGATAALTAALAVCSRIAPRRSLADRAPLAFLVAGLLCGIALTFRPDLAPAVVLGFAPLVAIRSAATLFERPWARFALGALVGCAPLIVWAAIVGPERIEVLVDDLLDSRSGRRLPLPGPGTDLGQVLVATIAISALALLGGVLRLRADSQDRDARMMLALGLLVAALLPSAFQRADEAHILPVAAIAIGISPLVIAGFLRGLRRPTRWRPAALALAAVIAIGVAAAFVNRGELAVRVQIESIDSGANLVSVGERSFRVGDDASAAALNELLPRLERESRPGESLFVGPRDLRRTNYADTFVYYLLPELEPASFYTEVNPGTANAADSGLADELRGADWALLTTRWDGFLEPNDSQLYGSPLPNRVIERRFQVAARGASYTLYRRLGSGP